MTATAAMRRCALVVAAGLLALDNASAQQPGAGTAHPPAAMEEPAPGDHWNYEIQDDILGTARAPAELAVTEVSPTEISARMTSANRNPSSQVWDRAWNLIDRGDTRFSPNDGSGIQRPLAVGKAWSFKDNALMVKTGQTWVRSGTSKVTAQESVTTKAGTFDTFRIETSTTMHNATTPAKPTTVVQVTWYASAIDHWVKRTVATRQDGHLVDSATQTLVSYGRRETPVAGAHP